MRGLTHRIGRLFVLAGAVSLAALHVAVLFRRVADGTLLKPLVVLQWLVAIGLLATLWALRRRGISVFRGRPAAGFWIVVALMHGIVSLPGAPGLVGAFNAVPVTDALPVVGAGLLAGALAALAGLLTSRSRVGLARVGELRPATLLAPILRQSQTLGARAPPA